MFTAFLAITPISWHRDLDRHRLAQAGTDNFQTSAWNRTSLRSIGAVLYRPHNINLKT